MTSYSASKLSLLSVADGKDQFNLDAIATAFPTAVLHVATATTSGPTRTNNDYTTGTPILEEMSLTADFHKNPLILFFTGTFTHSAAGSVTCEFFDGTTGLTNSESTITPTTTLTMVYPYIPATGSRTLSVKWRTSAATATATSTRRSFGIFEIRR